MESFYLESCQIYWQHMPLSFLCYLGVRGDYVIMCVWERLFLSYLYTFLSPIQNLWSLIPSWNSSWHLATSFMFQFPLLKKKMTDQLHINKDITSSVNYLAAWLKGKHRYVLFLVEWDLITNGNLISEAYVSKSGEMWGSKFVLMFRYEIVGRGEKSSKLGVLLILIKRCDRGCYQYQSVVD